MDAQGDSNGSQDPAVQQKKMTEEEEKESALRASIKEYGQNSYYYAHAKKKVDLEGAEIFKGDGLIYGGDPVLLGKKESTKQESFKK
mmetsp:Transcript_16319/g.15666  ORF Transcript_16319/g.15666 Transcript_16319/m.15666 type:complete len:87 (-) Transcript_16319:344-604(-)